MEVLFIITFEWNSCVPYLNDNKQLNEHQLHNKIFTIKEQLQRITLKQSQRKSIYVVHNGYVVYLK